MGQSKETASLYKQAILKGMELEADFYPTEGGRLNFTFHIDDNRTAFWKWFQSVERGATIAKGWFNPIIAEVEISFNDLNPTLCCKG